jgi:hypothetical protein
MIRGQARDNQHRSHTASCVKAQRSQQSVAGARAGPASAAGPKFEPAFKEVLGTAPWQHTQAGGPQFDQLSHVVERNPPAPGGVEHPETLQGRIGPPRLSQSFEDSIYEVFGKPRHFLALATARKTADVKRKSLCRLLPVPPPQVSPGLTASGQFSHRVKGGRFPGQFPGGTSRRNEAQPSAVPDRAKARPGIRRAGQPPGCGCPRDRGNRSGTAG